MRLSEGRLGRGEIKEFRAGFSREGINRILSTPKQGKVDVKQAILAASGFFIFVRFAYRPSWRSTLRVGASPCALSASRWRVYGGSSFKSL
jgi:hypothetical protein